MMENPMEEFFTFCDKHFTPITKDECKELIRQVRENAKIKQDSKGYWL
jgi:hypothetical protein